MDRTSRLSSGCLWVVLSLVLTLAGCTTSTRRPDKDQEAEIKAERQKLPPEDQALVDAQEWCVIQTEERLGSMGPPIRLIIRRQPVFICCESCQVKAEGDPDKTLATLAELKARKRLSVKEQK